MKSMKNRERERENTEIRTLKENKRKIDKDIEITQKK